MPAPPTTPPPAHLKRQAESTTDNRKRRALAIANEVVDEPDDPTPEKITVCGLDLATLLLVLQSLRPSGKDTSSLAFTLQNKCPTVENAVFGDGIHPRGADEKDLRSVLKDTFTGIVVKSISTDGTRFSIYLIPANVDGLGEGEKFACFMAPQDLIEKLKVYSDVTTGTLQFECDRVVLSISSHAGSSSRIQFRYLDEPDGADLSVLYQKYGNRDDGLVPVTVDGIGLKKKLMAMQTKENGAKATIELHEMGPSGSPTEHALTFCMETGTWTVIDGYIAKGDGSALDFRYKLPSKGTSDALEEDPEAVYAAAEAAMRPQPKALNDLSRFIELSAIYQQRMEEGILALGTPMPLRGKVIPEAYTKRLRQLFLGSHLLSLFSNMTSDLPHGITLVLATKSHIPLVVVTPLSKCTGVHLMAYGREES